ncbi:STAS domain-containing protein [Metabacillus fastidiosus]|uniref:STAS domain-containing protein n=1 Tax=Metabacillus fastidiosus TaxID=1458 RepID=UPI003D28EEEC
MQSFKNFSNYISRNTEKLSAEVVEAVISGMKLNIPEWEKEQALTLYTALFGFFGKSLVDGDENTVPDELINWSKKNAAMQMTNNGKISEIVVRYPMTRDVLTEILTRISIELNLSIEENAFIIKRINNMLDVSLNETVFAFERFSDQFKEETQKELAKLSAPIVPVKDGIVVLPLVGDMNCYRLSHIIDHVIPKIAELNVDHVIADFSGIFTINEEVAQHLHQIGSTIGLMGIHFITTGLRPELAQAIVQRGINYEGESFATVKQALESIK